MNHKLSQKFCPVHQINGIAGCVSMRILIESPTEIQTEALDLSFVEPPGISCAQFNGLCIYFIQKPGFEFHIALYPLEVKIQLQSCVGIPFKLEKMYAVVPVFFPVVEGKCTHAADVVNIFEIKAVVNGKVPVVFFGIVHTRIVKTDLGILENIFLNPHHTVQTVKFFLIIAFNLQTGLPGLIPFSNASSKLAYIPIFTMAAHITVVERPRP